MINDNWLLNEVHCCCRQRRTNPLVAQETIQAPVEQCMFP